MNTVAAFVKSRICTVTFSTVLFVQALELFEAFCAFCCCAFVCTSLEFFTQMPSAVNTSWTLPVADHDSAKDANTDDVEHFM